MIYFEFEFGFGLGHMVIDRMVGVLGRCILVWRSGISVYPANHLVRSESKSSVGDIVGSLFSRAQPFQSNSLQ